jgi:hypothetical protein
LEFLLENFFGELFSFDEEEVVEVVNDLSECGGIGDEVAVSRRDGLRNLSSTKSVFQDSDRRDR